MTPSHASRPLFIGGDHRSGTTLLSLILDSHPDLVVGPEIDFLEPIDLGPHVAECCELLIADDPRVQGLGVEAREPSLRPGVQFARQCRRFGLGFDELLAIVRAAMVDLASDLGDFPDRCALIDRIGEARRIRSGKARWGLKIQRNIVLADRFRRAWPDSEIVHILRDGRDVAASQLRGGRPWGYRTIEEAAGGWVEVLEGVRSSASGPAIHTLRYEDLVAEPEPTLRRLLRGLGVDWSPAVLDHQGAAHSLLEASFGHPSAEAAGRPIYRDAVGRHRRDLSAGEVADFDRLAGPWLLDLGYLPEAR